MKVCKFGGTSMANAECISKVRDIIVSDPEVAYVIVSAPGKREKNDTKVTDLLYRAYDHVSEGMTASEAFAPVRERFDAILSELNLDVDFSSRYEEIENALSEGTTKDYIASRGEYLSAIVLSALTGWEFIDAKEFVRFDDKGNFLSEETNTYAGGVFHGVKKAIIPGFYGASPDGKIKTFSRGGSDISGAIVARAVNARIYENWTDVDGFMKCDPRLVDNPEIMDIITYKELRELSYMGANVLHPDSIFPVRKKDIPINIRNTFNPSAKGTFIVPYKNFITGEFKRKDSTVTGIAGKRDFIVITVEKSMMNNELGFARRVLEVVERYGLGIEHMPSGIDTLSVILDGHVVNSELLAKVVDGIKAVCQPDIVTCDGNMALIAVVGHGMNKKKGTANKVCRALYEADVNIRMIDQGSSEMNIIVGVENKDYEKAIVALYGEFMD